MNKADNDPDLDPTLPGYSLEEYDAVELIPYLEHPRQDLRERAIAELRRRAELYQAADNTVWGWSHAKAKKAYGGDKL
jgi:hypothetical protein